MFELENINIGMYRVQKEGDMIVPGLIIANEELLEAMDMQAAMSQVKNVACLKGIVGYSIAMPDMHWGYGFPIGGVAAMDKESGIISPGGVGYDINCGVRLAITPIEYKDISEKQKDTLMLALYKNIQGGVGGKYNSRGLSEEDYEGLARYGSNWGIKKGYGVIEDIEHTESKGCIAGGNIERVSERAKQRGAYQLGTIGSGNHFVEIGSIEDILHHDVAKQWDVVKGLTYILIHSGSRGFGHQICQESLNLLVERGFNKGIPDTQLVAAPINSKEGEQYLSSMAVAANYAFNNRQLILHKVRYVFKEVFNIDYEEGRQLYDVCHNIAKVEKHFGKMVCVHRKGATRAFGPGEEELSALFKKTGQPVLVPGDMGRASYLMVGQGNKMTFASCCHGAGRARSRVKSLKQWGGKDVIEHMRKQDVLVKAWSKRTVAEEMPDAYKDVDVVTNVVEQAKLAKRVARLRPHIVIKG